MDLRRGVGPARRRLRSRRPRRPPRRERHARPRRRWGARVGTAVALVAALLAGTMSAAGAYTVENLDGGTRIVLHSKRFSDGPMHYTMNVELRIDGTYFWWLDVHAGWMYRDVQTYCVVFLTDAQIPLRIDSDTVTVGRNQWKTFSGPVPTLSSRQPYSSLLETYWGSLQENFQASCQS